MSDTDIYTTGSSARADVASSDSGSEDSVVARLQALEGMTHDGLRTEWRRLYRAHPPKRVARDLLVLAVCAFRRIRPVIPTASDQLFRQHATTLWSRVFEAPRPSRVRRRAWASACRGPTDPAGRPSVRARKPANFCRYYQAGSWDKKRRVVAKVEWHPGELVPRVGFIVTNLSRPAQRVVGFYIHRGTAEQDIKEGKNAIKWTRLSCRKFRNNEVRLQRHALAYNLGNFMRTLALPKELEYWSLTTLREKLVKIGAKVVRHWQYVTFQLAEVAMPRELFRKILSLIDDLRPRPVPA